MTAKITKRQADAVLTLVRKQFAGWLNEGDEGPKLIPDFDWSGTGPGPAIVWEEGPFEWVFLVQGGEDEFGFTLPERTAPAGTFLEPITGWALGIYPT